MFDYVSKIPIQQEGSFIERASVFAGGLLGRVKAVVDEVWEITEDHVEKVLKWVAGCPGMLSEQAHAGFGLIVKLFDEANPEVLATLKAAIPTEALVDSLESIGSAFGRSRSRVTPTMQGAAAETALLRDAVNAATHGTFSGSTGLRQALENAAVGSTKPFKSKQKLEACLRMHGDDLTQQQVDAIRNARLSLFNGAAKPAVGTPMTRVMKTHQAQSMLSSGIAQVQGFMTNTATLAGTSSTESLRKRLRLDYEGGFAAGDGHVRLEFPLPEAGQAALKVPQGRGHFAASPDTHEVVGDGAKPPFAGTGFAAATDGHLVPEFVVPSGSAIDLPEGTRIRSKNSAGAPLPITVIVNGNALTSANWQLQTVNGMIRWVPTP